MTQHPKLYVVQASCSSCGATFAVRSTANEISTDVCFNRRRALAAA